MATPEEIKAYSVTNTLFGTFTLPGDLGVVIPSRKAIAVNLLPDEWVSIATLPGIEITEFEGSTEVFASTKARVARKLVNLALAEGTSSEEGDYATEEYVSTAINTALGTCILTEVLDSINTLESPETAEAGDVATLLNALITALKG